MINNFFSDYIIGGVEDQVEIFQKHHLYNSVDGYAPNIFTNQPLFTLFYDIPSLFFNPIIYTNIYNLAQILINGITSYLIFRSIKFNREISLILSVIFIFSPFTFYNIGNHPALLTIWPLLLFIKLLLKNDFTNKACFINGTILAVAALFNNYFGYFGLIFYTFYFFIFLLLSKSEIKFTLGLKNYILTIVSFFSVFFLFISPYLFGMKSSESSANLGRSLEDFFHFSSRPWYYFLPSIDNPWLGYYTERSISILQLDWGYWLTNNYFPSEHSISYLGYTNFIIAIIGFYYFFKHKNIEKFNRKMMLSLLFTSVGLFLLTLPPYFTVSLYKIYTPSYLIMEYFPLFRTTARLGLLILLIELIYMGLGLEYLRVIFTKISYRFYILFLCLISFLSLLEFYIPIRLDFVGDVPVVYKYINENLPQDSVLVAYPYNSSIDVLFWSNQHNRVLMNPRDYKSPTFDSEEFTQNLKTPEGLKLAKDLGATHLIFFKYAGDKDRVMEEKFFKESKNLTLIGTFDELISGKEYQSDFLKIVDFENYKRSYSYLYKIN